MSNHNHSNLSPLQTVSKLKTDSELALSKLPVGSSAKIKLGEFASARATATLCCSPPDNLNAGRLSFEDNPSVFKI